MHQLMSPARMASLAIAALSVLAATGSARSATAQEARVSFTGKDEVTVRQEIRRASAAVCTAADRQGAFLGLYRVQDCLAAAESRAIAQYRAWRRQQTSAPAALASTDPIHR